MNVSKGSVERGGRTPTLLLLYSEPEPAVTLFRRLSAGAYDLILCAASTPIDRWRDEFQPDLVLFLPPSQDDELLKACEALRSKTARPIVVLSDRGEEQLVARVLDAGIDEYLVLPIGDRELTARIDAMIRRLNDPAGAQETQAIGGLTLSSTDLSVELNGRKVFLTPIEFRLLACLVSAPGRVFTHEALMSRVWGAEYVDSRHYLHLYIRYLREKLENEPKSPRLILSEWGVGYRLQPPEVVTS